MHKSLQERSEYYWVTAKTTYLAAAEYYDKQEAVIREILGRIGPVGKIGDVGCGDGRYTFAALDYADEVLGFDIGPSLIAQAEAKRSGNPGQTKIRFQVGSFDQFRDAGPYDVVLCLGVLSAVIDDAKFRNALDCITQSVKLGGTLVTKDTLANGPQFTSEQGDYVAVYRNRQAYIHAFAQHGLLNRERLELMKATETTSNAVYVFSAASS